MGILDRDHAAANVTKEFQIVALVASRKLCRVKGNKR